MGPTNGVVGDSFGIDLPEVQVDKTQLIEEQKAARFSRTEEFKKLKEHLEGRIAFYQTQLPNGNPVANETTLNDWVVANCIIAEFKAVIQAYENARAVVEEAQGVQR